MGAIISKFKKKKTSFEILEDLEDKIKAIEEYGQNTEQQHKKIVGRLLVYSVGLYVLIAALFYIFYSPATIKQQVLYAIPLLLFPFLLIFVKRLVSWYYSKKLDRNKSKLFDLRQTKKKILEEVMDKETYKVAKDILEKFAPETQPRKVPPIVSLRPVNTTPLNTGQIELRKRSVESARLTAALVPTTAQTQVESSAVAKRVPLMPLPAPILPQDRNVVDRLVEYLIGDGPNNRYALICSKCSSHNGMILKEDYEFTSFRCCYCFVFNPSRKQRPEAPKLQPLGRFDLREPDSETDAESDSPSSEEGKNQKKTPDALNTEDHNLTDKTSNNPIGFEKINDDVEKDEPNESIDLKFEKPQVPLEECASSVIEEDMEDVSDKTVLGNQNDNLIIDDEIENTIKRESDDLKIEP